MLPYDMVHITLTNDLKMTLQVKAKVPIEILPGKGHITWVLAVMLFAAEFQMEPLAPNVIYYYTSEYAVLH